MIVVQVCGQKIHTFGKFRLIFFLLRYAQSVVLAVSTISVMTEQKYNKNWNNKPPIGGT